MGQVQGRGELYGYSERVDETAIRQGRKWSDQLRAVAIHDCLLLP